MKETITKETPTHSVIRPALSVFILLSGITGVAYPLLTTGVGQTLFPEQAHGSLLESNGKTIGSALIGQEFTDPKYIWGRLSATGPAPYNAAASSGSNLGPLNPALKAAVEGRLKALRDADPENTAKVPVDLVTASGSGLDPHISPAAALYQSGRVARLRQLPQAQVEALILQHTEGRQWGLFGEPRVNVLQLNLALDQQHATGQ